MNKKGKKQNLVSLLLTILVIAMYLIPNFAQAVSVNVLTDKAEYTPTDSIVNANLTVTIREGERIPVQDLSLLLNDIEICKFNFDGSKITACTGITIAQISPGAYGEGILNATDEATSEFTSFGYGLLEYGYTDVVSYNILLDKTGLEADTYELKLSVNAVGTVNSHIYSGETLFDVLSETEVNVTIPEDFVAVSVPSSISYGTVWTGYKSSEKELTIENTGSLPITVQPMLAGSSDALFNNIYFGNQNLVDTQIGSYVTDEIGTQALCNGIPMAPGENPGDCIGTLTWKKPLTIYTVLDLTIYTGPSGTKTGTIYYIAMEAP